jgi:Tfp pilus assembly protein PilN
MHQASTRSRIPLVIRRESINIHMTTIYISLFAKDQEMRQVTVEITFVRNCWHVLSTHHLALDATGVMAKSEISGITSVGADANKRLRFSMHLHEFLMLCHVHNSYLHLIRVMLIIKGT